MSKLSFMSKICFCLAFCIVAFGALSTFGTERNASPSADRAPGTDVRFMVFNIWGDYFGNPPEERADNQIAVVSRYAPDVLALQEVTVNWWKSRLISELQAEYAVVSCAEEGKTSFIPLFYRKDRFELLEEGTELFHAKLDQSKGITWAVLKDKRNGKTFVAWSTHYWWKGTDESNFIRTVNSQRICARLGALKAKWNCPSVGGGDFNCRVDSDPLNVLQDAGYFSAQEIANDASPEASHHGDPVRGKDGKYHGFPRPAENVKAQSIDHIFLEKTAFTVLKERVVLDQDALDSSDHSPVYVDLKFN